MTITLAYSTFPDHKTAKTIIAQLLTRRLIACANIIGEGESHYVWNGDICHTNEVYVLFKLSPATRKTFIDTLTALHPYDCPAIICWDAPKGYAPFMQHVITQTHP